MSFKKYVLQQKPANTKSKNTKWYEGVEAVLLTTTRKYGTVWHTWGRTKYTVEQFFETVKKR